MSRKPENPDAILFLRISQEGVFQQPRDLSPVRSGQNTLRLPATPTTGRVGRERPRAPVCTAQRNSTRLRNPPVNHHVDFAATSCARGPKSKEVFSVGHHSASGNVGGNFEEHLRRDGLEVIGILYRHCIHLVANDEVKLVSIGAPSCLAAAGGSQLPLRASCGEGGDRQVGYAALVEALG
jgi:hypothetical protein